MLLEHFFFYVRFIQIEVIQHTVLTKYINSKLEQIPYLRSLNLW